jgi:hypothetical protein
LRRSVCRDGRGNLFSVQAGDLPHVSVFRLDIPQGWPPVPRLSFIEVAG